MGTGVPISTYPMEPVGAFGCKGPECPTVQGTPHCCRSNLRVQRRLHELVAKDQIVSSCVLQVRLKWSTPPHHT